MNGLQASAWYGDASQTEALLAAGVSTETKDGYGRTPLALAAGWGRIECIEALLAAGANIESIDRHNRTPLMFAALTGETKCIELLLSHGANIDALDKNGKTALYLASHDDAKQALHSAQESKELASAIEKPSIKRTRDRGLSL